MLQFKSLIKPFYFSFAALSKPIIDQAKKVILKLLKNFIRNKTFQKLL